MGLLAKEEGGSFEMVEPNTYVARCYRVIDLGTHHDEKWDKDVHKIMLSWELPTALMETGDYKGQPFSIHNRYTLSLSEKAHLRKDLEAWRGKAFTEEELNGFDISMLLGATCFINVVHSTDGKYANISSIMKLPKGTNCPDAVNDALILDLDSFDQKVFDTLSDKMQGTIKSSLEYGLLAVPEDEAPPVADDGRQEPFSGGQGERNDQPHEGFEEELPF